MTIFTTVAAPTAVGAGDMVVAQLTTTSGIALRDILLAIVGSLIILVMAWHALGYLVSQEYGKLVSMVFAALIVTAFAYFPDQSMNVLKAIVSAVFG